MSASGPPNWVAHDPETAEGVREFMRGRSPSAWVAAYLEGEQVVSVRAVAVRANFGNDRAEIEFEDGRHVTVHIPDEFRSLAEVRE